MRAISLPIVYVPYIEWLHVGQKHGIIRLFEAGGEMAEDGMPVKGFVWTAGFSVDCDTVFVRAALAAPPQGAMPGLVRLVRGMGCKFMRWERVKVDGIREKRFSI